MSSPRPTRHEVDFQCPVNFRVVHHFELQPEIIELLHDFLNRSESIPMTTQEFQAYLDGKVKEVTDKITAERDEVMTAINASVGVPDTVKDALESAFSNIGTSIAGIFTPTGTDTGTGTGGLTGSGSGTTPTDTGTTPTPTPMDTGTPVPSSVAP